MADFGISRLLIETRNIESTGQLKGSMRWMAIELFPVLPGMADIGIITLGLAKAKLPTKETDVWAFGMLVYV